MAVALALAATTGFAAAAQDKAVAEPAGQAKPAPIPTSVFAAHSPFSEARLSPDGKRIALKAVINGQTNIAIMDTSTKKVVDRRSLEDDSYELEWFRWAGNDRILFSLSGTSAIYGEDYRFTRLYVLDLVARQTTYVGTKEQGLDGDDVLYVDPDGAYVLLQMQPDLFTFSSPEVRRFPLDGSNTRHDEKVLSDRTNVWDWIADDKGVVRIGLALTPASVRVLYRKNADDPFKEIARLTGKEDDDRTSLYGAMRIINGSDDGLALDKGPGGKIALRHINLATGELGAVIYENPDWDVTDLAIGDDGKPVAAYYTDDSDRIVWLQPDMAALQQKLDRAFKGAEAWITSRARDDSKMIVWVGAANDPGAYYLYTAATHHADLLTDVRPDLPLASLADVKPVTYPARDGTRVHAYLTLPRGRDPSKLPLIIMPHGGPYEVRDKLDYSDRVQFLANRGYAVLQPNYRGSGGYGETFEKLGDGQIGRAMQDDLDDAEDWAVAQGFADKARVCVVGSSYGGYAALWAVIRNPERYRCAASFAGVTDWEKILKYDADFFTRDGSKKWNARVRGSEKGFDMDSVSPAKQAARLTRPVLIAHGKRDSRVPYSQFKEMRGALESASFAKAEYLVFDKEGHGFDTPEDEQKWYDALDAFLKKYNPAD
jgi:dipeptidyl aminopeptidase/acylaminoacyl peptidase